MSVKQQTPAAKKSAPASPMSVEIFGERGVLQAVRGPAPAEIEALGERGVLQAVRGPPPPEIEALGEVGVLQAVPGPPSAAVLLDRFLAAHDDAVLLESGKVLCTTTGHEMPARLNDLLGH